ncbi:MAG: hypothetical protein ACN6NJ_11675 [Acinetobacter sp.]
MKHFLCVGLLLITGCASTGVIPIGTDSYFIGKKDGTPGLGVSLENKASVYREANDFCKKNNQTMIILDEKTIPVIPARLGSTELKFRCQKN